MWQVPLLEQAILDRNLKFLLFPLGHTPGYNSRVCKSCDSNLMKCTVKKNRRLPVYVLVCIGAVFFFNHNSLLGISDPKRVECYFCDLYGDVSMPALSKIAFEFIIYSPKESYAAEPFNGFICLSTCFSKCKTAKLYLALYTFKLIVRINPCVLGAPCMWVVDGHLNRVQISFSNFSVYQYYTTEVGRIFRALARLGQVAVDPWGGGRSAEKGVRQKQLRCPQVVEETSTSREHVRHTY